MTATPRPPLRALTLLAALFSALLLSAPALAIAPFVLDQGNITDKVGALGDRRDDVQAAIDRLQSDAEVGFYVVYVDSFGNLQPDEWANTTAVESGLGTDDLLLAIATEDRRYTWSVEEDFPLDDEKLNEVAKKAIEPELARDEWAQATINAADGYRAVAAGEPVPDSSGNDSRLLTGLLCLAAAVAVAIAGFLWWRTLRSPKEKDSESEGTPVAELEGRADTLLVETDDALRTSELELAFAQSEFGEAATADFAATVEGARTDLADAFRVRQQLDDERPETESEQRDLLTRIIDRLNAANSRLDADAEQFDRLRDLGRRAPEGLERLRGMQTEVTAALPGVDETLSQLRESYPETAIGPVAEAADDARDRMLFVGAHLDAAHEAIADGRSGEAAVELRACEEALSQGQQLVNSVVRRSQELRRAEHDLPEVVDRVDREISAASEDEADDERLRAAVASARQSMEEIRSQTAAGEYDPIALTLKAEQTAEALAEQTERLRDEEENARRAHDQLRQALDSAVAAIGAAEDYVATHRGAVGPRARTRLNEAKAALAHAQHDGASEPVASLKAATRAGRLASEAADLAERDVQAYRDPLDQRVPGPMGNSSNAGAILGGILLGGMLGGGGRGGGRSPGWGQPSHRPGPGSFGGVGTRGRRGGGGRF
ncbi:TPM domain-containing protein [Salininema proteolyticum]|uniref:TPM domain-containing protein n=1 Tax=Salininema proteolyticum TaxID=1607685 RepID=A0ABV8TZ09_9ACTN